jgi:hypothetical protein
MKVRASAGAASFKRKQSLERALKEAEQQVRRLKRELSDDPGAGNRRVQAAKERAAKARREAVEAALAEIPLIEEKREAQAKKERRAVERKDVRASTTDAECRVMKMADGGFRPAFNVQQPREHRGHLRAVREGVRARAGAQGSRDRSTRAEARRQQGGGGLAPADGDREREADLRPARLGRGTDER